MCFTARGGSCRGLYLAAGGQAAERCARRGRVQRVRAVAPGAALPAGRAPQGWCAPFSGSGAGLWFYQGQPCLPSQCLVCCVRRCASCRPCAARLGHTLFRFRGRFVVLSGATLPTYPVPSVLCQALRFLQAARRKAGAHPCFYNQAPLASCGMFQPPVGHHLIVCMLRAKARQSRRRQWRWRACGGRCRRW